MQDNYITPLKETSMKPPQFILTQEEYFDNIDEDFNSEGEMKLKYPFLYNSIQKLGSYLGMNLVVWEIQEGYIVDDYFEITYNLKENSSIYFAVSGNMNNKKVLNMDFELSREVIDVTENFISGISMEEDEE